MNEDLETLKENILLFKPQLDKYLKEKLNPEPSEKLRDDIVKAIKEVLVRFSPYDMLDYVTINVHATPEELKEHKITITYQALDELGEEYLRMLNSTKESIC